MVGDQLDSIEQRSRALLRRLWRISSMSFLAEEQLRTFSGSGSIGESINLVRNFLASIGSSIRSSSLAQVNIL
jgi:hypothetical protein